MRVRRSKYLLLLLLLRSCQTEISHINYALKKRHSEESNNKKCRYDPLAILLKGLLSLLVLEVNLVH